MKQTYVVFISLIIDLLAFTLILPLMPKIFDFYASNKDDHVYNFLQDLTNQVHEKFFSNASERFNSVLFGGIIGSLFSFLQFLSSAFTGALSDVYGRKSILVLTMIGTLVSYILWSQSSIFLLFLVSRIVGGISKANVSLCISIMTDLTDLSTRSAAMALVGIAFSLGFIFGPIIGAIFSSTMGANSYIVYAYPAYFAIFLNVINILFVLKFFKESLPIEKRAKSLTANISNSLQYVNPVSLFNFSIIKSCPEISSLRKIGVSYFMYLFIYSGLEFTLTFLVHNRFNYNSMQQGKMFLFIGILMSLIQGGYVRRIKQEKQMSATIRAIYLLIPAFVLVAFARTNMILYLGLALYSYSSAVVVSCFTVMVSNYGNFDEKGAIMGTFRSIGALARATGPMIASFVYWTYGSTALYLTGSLALAAPLIVLRFTKTGNQEIKAKSS